MEGDRVGSVVIGVGVEEDAEAAEVVLVAEHRPQDGTIGRIPDGHAVTEQVPSGACHLERRHQFPVTRIHRLKEGRHCIEC